MQRLAILADDLTGASDSGVQFARKGLYTQVIFDWKNMRDAYSINTIVIDTDSRSITGEQAYARVKDAAEALNKEGITFIYKKVDSTLRGNLGQEIDTVMDVYGFEAAIVAPAFPRIGRTTVQGKHYLNGVPIHETEIARDPKTPVAEAEISSLLASQSKRESVSVDLQTLRKGSAEVRDRIHEAVMQKKELIVFDAETDEDLRLIANLVSFYGNRFLWVGSAGLAEYLPVNENKKTYVWPLQEIQVHKPVMLVAGSISKVTREQITTVNEQKDIHSVELDPIALLTSTERHNNEEDRCYWEIVRALDKGRDISFYAGSSSEQVQSAIKIGADKGLDSSFVSNQIADALGRIAARAVSAYSLQGIVLTGGDTAKSVCRHLGVHGIELLAELEPGIPLGRLLGANNLTAVTKAGAFGNKHSLLYAMKILKGAKADE